MTGSDRMGWQGNTPEPMEGSSACKLEGTGERGGEERDWEGTRREGIAVTVTAIGSREGRHLPTPAPLCKGTPSPT